MLRTKDFFLNTGFIKMTFEHTYKRTTTGSMKYVFTKPGSCA
jgi:hypothetical protein